ncbi:MAG: hypothetical protein JXD19_11595 [Deltaproteobacteria bacterium]|nr:hypothetical protein [Deltaproteobacteria bacterium]
MARTSPGSALDYRYACCWWKGVGHGSRFYLFAERKQDFFTQAWFKNG